MDNNKNEALAQEFFSDESILEEDTAMIWNGEIRTNGVGLMVKCPPNVAAVEIVLEYGELKAALACLEKDREAMPHLYSENK